GVAGSRPPIRAAAPSTDRLVRLVAPENRSGREQLDSLQSRSHMAVVGGMVPATDWEVDMVHQLTSLGDLMDGPSSRTLHEKLPLIFRIDTSRRQLRAVAILAILAIARPAAQAASSSGCERLAGQKLPNTTITAAP